MVRMQPRKHVREITQIVRVPPGSMSYYFNNIRSYQYQDQTLKSGSQKMQASMVRRWLNELESVNRLENQGSPRSLCPFPTNPKSENIRCRINTEDTRRLSSASSQAARPLGWTAAALAVEWTPRPPRVANARYKSALNLIQQLSEQEGAPSFFWWFCPLRDA